MLVRRTGGWEKVMGAITRHIALACALAGFVSPAVAQTFLGYPCTIDCSGHEAGYEWAERNGVNSAWDCGGNSRSFIEGCEAYAEEQEADESDYYDLLGDEESEESNW